MGVMANIFYLEKGYKISEIATFSKFLVYLQQYLVDLSVVIVLTNLEQ